MRWMNEFSDERMCGGMDRWMNEYSDERDGGMDG